MIDPRLPLIDLHRHLDGNVRLGTIIELADKHGIALPAYDVEQLRPHVQITGKVAGLMDFIGRFKYLTAVLIDEEAVRRIAYENLLDAAAEGIDYVELRFSPWFMAETHGLDPAAVVDAAADGAAAGELETGVKHNLIGILSRTYGAATAHAELNALIRFADRLAALDLAGDEVNFPAAQFRDHFARARDAGLHITVHAGEVDGPASVWSAIRDLGAERIGHGIRSHEDPALMAYLAEHRIGLEMNLTSNLHVGIFEDYPAHPVRRYLEQGVLLNINTDDPAISGIDLPHEFNVAAPQAGLTEEDLRQIQRNALEMAFLSDAEKQALLRKKAADG